MQQETTTDLCFLASSSTPTKWWNAWPTIRSTFSTEDGSTNRSKWKPTALLFSPRANRTNNSGSRYRSRWYQQFVSKHQLDKRVAMVIQRTRQGEQPEIRQQKTLVSGSKTTVTSTPTWLRSTSTGKAPTRRISTWMMKMQPTSLAEAIHGIGETDT